MTVTRDMSWSQWVWIGIAVAISAFWLWINYCLFPLSSWNDIRLVPTFMAAAGEAVYTLPGNGVLTTWMYGPVPLWLWSPALLGNSAISALLIADFLNIAITVAAIALTCAYWPVPGISRTSRWLAFAAVIVVWPDHAWQFLQADNLAIALALAAQLLLITSTRGNASSRRGWLAALATAAALGCKQTTLGILVAQLVWLACEHDCKVALRHLVRTLLCGGVLAAIAIWQFGFSELWFGIVKTAAQLPWVEQPWSRLAALTPILVVQWSLPVLVAILIGKSLFTTSHPLRLPVIAWLFCLPLNLAGLLSTGGSTNNLHGFQLLAAPLLLVVLAAVSKRTPRFYRALAVVFVLGIFCLRISHERIVSIRPALSKVREAMALQTAYHQQIWLPWNPLVTYFGDGAFYHAEDGIYVRFITGPPVSLAQARAHLPPHFHLMAFPGEMMQWDVASKLAPPDHRTRQFGEWFIIEWAQ